MGLRVDMESALSETLEDADLFGWLVTITDPAGNSASFKCAAADVAQVVDPETGVVVSGRMASIAVRISSLTAAGLSLPVGIVELSSKPWVVTFDDINGNSYTFKVRESNPDRAIGVVVCCLEVFNS